MDHPGDSTGAPKNPLVFEGRVIGDKGENLNLTDMWHGAREKALREGRDVSEFENRRPAQWARHEGSAFIDAVAVRLNVSVGHIYKAARGKNGATWANWQIGIAYGKYLDHDLHMWCNTAAREKMEGKAAATISGLTPYDKQIIGNIVKNCTGVVLKEQLQELLPALVETAVQARLADKSVLIRRGETAIMIWDRFNLPAGIRGRSQWLGYRLMQFGCSLAFGERAEIAGNAVRLFDPDKSNFAMKNGLLAAAKKWAAEKLGQGSLNLKGKGK